MTSGRDEYLGRTKKHIDYDLEAKLRTWWLNNTGGAAKDGITVRDYFAAKAMQALIEKYDESPAESADEAYDWADAMMKARVLDKQGEL